LKLLVLDDGEIAGVAVLCAKLGDTVLHLLGVVVALSLDVLLLHVGKHVVLLGLVHLKQIHVDELTLDLVILLWDYDRPLRILSTISINIIPIITDNPIHCLWFLIIDLKDLPRCYIITRLHHLRLICILPLILLILIKRDLNSPLVTTTI